MREEKGEEEGRKGDGEKAKGERDPLYPSPPTHVHETLHIIAADTARVWKNTKLNLHLDTFKSVCISKQNHIMTFQIFLATLQTCVF